MYFLVEYDREAGMLVTLSSFPENGLAQANRARQSAEIRLLREGRQLEVVLLEAESEDSLKKTHNRYFRSLSQLARSNNQ